MPLFHYIPKAFISTSILYSITSDYTMVVAIKVEFSRNFMARNFNPSKCFFSPICLLNKENKNQFTSNKCSCPASTDSTDWNFIAGQLFYNLMAINGSTD